MAQPKYKIQCKHDNHLSYVEGDKDLGFAKCPLCGGSDFIIVNFEGVKPKYSKECPYSEGIFKDKVIFEKSFNGDTIRVIQHSDNKRSLKINEIGYSCIYTDNKNRHEPAYRGIQEFIELVSTHLELKNICILGGGGGTIQRYLIKNFPSIKQIDSIEINPLIITLCRKYFIGDLLTNKKYKDKLNLIEFDAFDFVKQTTNIYDFIYVDLYLKDVIPPQVHQESFIHELKDCLVEYGVVAINITFLENYNMLVEIGRNYFSNIIVLNNPQDEEKYVVMTDKALE